VQYSRVVAIPFYFRVTCNCGSASLIACTIVAIPFYFRVTCNYYGYKATRGRELLPYPSIFGSLATDYGSPTSVGYHSCHTLLFSGHLQRLSGRRWKYEKQCCHTLLFSGHLQPTMIAIQITIFIVAIPFYFRVTCNRHFFRLDWLKTYLSIPRFSGNLPGSILSFQYLKK